MYSTVFLQTIGGEIMSIGGQLGIRLKATMDGGQAF